VKLCLASFASSVSSDLKASDFDKSSSRIVPSALRSGSRFDFNHSDLVRESASKILSSTGC